MNIITCLEPSREHDWIGLEQIRRFRRDFFEKVREVLSNTKYSLKTKEIAQGIYDSLMLWEYISWKQFDLVMRMWPQPVAERITRSRSNWRQFNAFLNYLDEKHWAHAFDDSRISL